MEKEKKEKIKIHLRSPEEQLAVYRLHKKQFPGRVIILIVPDKKGPVMLKKDIYICPRDKTFQDVMMQIRKNIDIKDHEGLYYFIGNSLISAGSSMGTLDDKYGLDDDFLRITICKQNMFGSVL